MGIVMQLAGRETFSRNEILAALTEDDFARLRAFLEPVPLSVGDRLCDPSKPMDYVYFIEKGFASVRAGANERSQMEVALIGREGLVGLPLLLGSVYPAFNVYAQVAGSGQRISAEAFLMVLDLIPALRREALVYAQVLIGQLGQAALANGRCNVLERLSRWLLMAQDRLDEDEIPLTQEFFALTLGVRRASVTVALQKLSQAKLILHKRALVVILDRAKLIEKAGEAYYMS